MSRTDRLSRFALVALGVALTALFAVLALEASEGRALQASVPWLPSVGLELAVRVDALSALFGLLVAGIGALIAVYAGPYLDHGVARFSAHVAVFMLAMLGVVVADDLILLYVCWELTGISSFFLIGFHHEDPEARAAARHALLVTVMGGLCLLAGLLLIGTVVGSFRISTVLERGDVLREHALYLPALVLVALGAFTKSAQVPFHSWLPRAMKAPTPASAYLHAATMVKAGVYLLARLSPALAGTRAWTLIVVPIGAITMVVGATRAFSERDIKRVLAYATVSALGLMTALLGVGTRAAVTAALVYLVAHALYKGALFLVAGALDHSMGIRDVRALRGLGRAMPLVSTTAALGAASFAGAPPLLGFLGKDLAYTAVWPGRVPEEPSGVLLVTTVVTSALFVAIALDAFVRPLFGRAAPERARDPSALMVAPALTLAIAGLVAGLAPGVVATLTSAAASEVVGASVPASLASFHGLTPELVASLLTLLAGAGLYAARAPLRRWGARLGQRLRPAAGYELALAVLAGVAERQTRFVQSGYLRRYALVLVASAALLVAVGSLGAPLALGEAGIDLEHGWQGAGLILVVIAAALVATVAQSGFTAIAAMGVVGLGVGLVFLLHGAPDLALTQFVVEVLNVALFVMAFYHLPPFARLSPLRSRVRDALLAAGFGVVMGVVVLIGSGTAPDSRVSDELLARSVPDGHGRNVVNVTLTDFRSLDTLGEVVALCTAAFGVAILLRRDGARS